MGELSGYQRVHLVGVGGAGMSALGKLLAQRGHRVSGSDLKPGRALDMLRDLGVDVWVGHRPAEAVAWDLVVVSSAVPDRDPEIRAALVAGVPVWRRPRLLQKMTTELPTLGITGTHGKTTSTAMAVHALRATGRDPSFAVGGELVELNTNAHLGDESLFVLEADEAFGTFVHLDLTGLLITNVESDHLDHYGSTTKLEDTFAEVAEAVDGPVVACWDDAGARRVAGRAGAVSYGFAEEASWRVGSVEHGQWSVAFTLRGPHGEVSVKVPRPGDHVARNAAGVLALLGEAGHDVARAAEGLAGFAGVRRRFEVRARLAGITVVDDYAHHPTEVAATLEAARQGSWKRIWAVFQPHRFSRTAELADAFGPTLAAADRVVVTEIYGAGERPEPGVTGRLVADAVAEAGGRVDFVPARRDLASFLDGSVTDGDLVLLLGAGDITLAADELAELLGHRT